MQRAENIMLLPQRNAQVIGLKTAAAQFPLALDVVADLLTDSLFPQEEIDRERNVIIEEVNMYLDRPTSRVREVFEDCLYGDTPAGWDTIGTKENILSFNRADFITYLNNQYRTNNTIICIAGAVPKNPAKLIENYFKTYAKARLSQSYQLLRSRNPCR
jgi:predicted Zn-dependent peptidase